MVILLKADFKDNCHIPLLLLSKIFPSVKYFSRVGNITGLIAEFPLFI